MDFSADHIGFVAAAYGLTGIVLVGLIIVVIAGAHAQHRALRKLEDGATSRRRKPVRAEEKSG